MAHCLLNNFLSEHMFLSKKSRFVWSDKLTNVIHLYSEHPLILFFFFFLFMFNVYIQPYGYDRLTRLFGTNKTCENYFNTTTNFIL